MIMILILFFFGHIIEFDQAAESLNFSTIFYVNSREVAVILFLVRDKFIRVNSALYYVIHRTYCMYKSRIRFPIGES